jgi:hypothetical protein
MNSLAFLKAAYIIAWVVYVGYLCRILLRMRLVEAERKEMEQGSRGGVRRS